MLDHGQVGPATPAISRRPSTHERSATGLTPPASRRSSVHDGRPQGMFFPLTPISPTASRRASTHESATKSRLGSVSETRPLRSSLLALENAAQLGEDLSDALDESAVENESEEEEQSPSVSTLSPVSPVSGGVSKAPETETIAENPTLEENASSASSAFESTVKPPPPTPAKAIPPMVARRLSGSAGGFSHPADIAAQLYANPKLAALRVPSGSGITSPTSPTQTPPSLTITPNVARTQFSPPLLINPKCSGYFVEPVGLARVCLPLTLTSCFWMQMKWMEPFLEEGRLEGKITCPNKKCGAKLGNYDWAGVCCSCKEWVVPVRPHLLSPLSAPDSLTDDIFLGILHPSIES